MGLVQTAALNRELRSLTPESVVEAYSGYTSETFGDGGDVPVVISALNEAEDLPSTLVSLALSDTKLHPIVVDNGSEDDTSDIAEVMGATVLSEPVPSKMRAHKKAFEYLDALGWTSNTTVLFTDADTIVGSGWAKSMMNSADRLDEGLGSTVFGLVVFSHSQSRITNLFRNFDHSIAQFRSRASRGMRLPIARGANCAIKLDKNEGVLREILQMPDDVFPQDEALRDLVVNLGGLAQPNLGLDAIAISRGDRYRSFAEYISARRRKISYRGLYARDYGADHSSYQEQ